MRHRLLVVFAVLWVALAARSAWATTIDPMTFPELVIQADFVGVVECTTAGGIVARRAPDGQPDHSDTE